MALTQCTDCFAGGPNDERPGGRRCSALALHPIPPFNCLKALRSIAGTCFVMSILMARQLRMATSHPVWRRAYSERFFGDQDRGAGTTKTLAPDLLCMEEISAGKKSCFQGVPDAETNTVCRTVVEGKSDLCQIIGPPSLS